LCNMEGTSPGSLLGRKLPNIGLDFVGRLQQIANDEFRRGTVSNSWYPAEFLNQKCSHSLFAQTVFVVLDEPDSCRLAQYVSVFIMCTIIYSVVMLVAATESSFNNPNDLCDLNDPTPDACKPIPPLWLGQMESVAIAIFSVEYFGRLLTVHAVPTDQHSLHPFRRQKTGFWKTIVFATSTMNLIDFAAILPWYLELFMASSSASLSVLRVLRLSRVLRVLKMGKYNTGMQVMGSVLTESLPALKILLVFTMLSVVLFGALIYFSEGTTFSCDPRILRDNPLGAYVRDSIDGSSIEITPFRSIPDSFWWVVTTITTVGYGDVVPTSASGKVVGTVCALFGILMVALPIGVIGVNFEAAYTRAFAAWYGAEDKAKQEGGSRDQDGLNISDEAKDQINEFEIKKRLKKGTLTPTETKVRVEPRQRVSTGKAKGFVEAGITGLQGAIQQQFDVASSLGVRLKSHIPIDSSLPCFPPEHLGGWRAQVFCALEDPASSRVAQVLGFMVIILILLATTAFCIETMPEFRHTPSKCTQASVEDDLVVYLAGDTSVLSRCVDRCEPRPATLFVVLECVCIYLFTLEYLLRVLFVHAYTAAEARGKGHAAFVATMLLPSRSGFCSLSPTHPVGATVLYMIQPINLIDLAAILPFYIELLFVGADGGKLAILRVLRVSRVFRVFKMGKYNSGMQMFAKVMIQSAPALGILCFFAFLSMIVFGTLIYYAEGTEYSTDFERLAYCSGVNATIARAQYPRGFYSRPTVDGNCLEITPFHSIAGSFWWVVATITTVGYGDFYPTSFIGKIISVFAFYMGVFMLAMPITIIGVNFSNEYNIWVERDGTTTPSCSVVDDGTVDHSTNEHQVVGSDTHKQDGPVSTSTVAKNNPIPLQSSMTGPPKIVV